MSKVNENHITTFIADFWGSDLQRLDPDNVFKSLGIVEMMQLMLLIIIASLVMAFAFWLLGKNN